MKVVKVLLLVLLFALVVVGVLSTPINWMMSLAAVMLLIAVLKNDPWQIFAFLVVFASVVYFFVLPLSPGNLSVFAVWIGTSLAVLFRDWI